MGALGKLLTNASDGNFPESLTKLSGPDVPVVVGTTQKNKISLANLVM